MTWKRLEARFAEWFFKPLVFVAPYLRTNYCLQGEVLVVKQPFRKCFLVRITELDEIGVETTDQGPFVEDVFWVLKQGRLRLRIGDPHPVFQQLMTEFSSLAGFDWKPFAEAMSCWDNRYFVCWRKSA